MVGSVQGMSPRFGHSVIVGSQKPVMFGVNEGSQSTIKSNQLQTLNFGQSSGRGFGIVLGVAMVGLFMALRSNSLEKTTPSGEPAASASSQQSGDIQKVDITEVLVNKKPAAKPEIAYHLYDHEAKKSSLAVKMPLAYTVSCTAPVQNADKNVLRFEVGIQVMQEIEKGQPLPTEALTDAEKVQIRQSVLEGFQTKFRDRLLAFIKHKKHILYYDPTDKHRDVAMRNFNDDLNRDQNERLNNDFVGDVEINGKKFTFRTHQVYANLVK